MAKLMASATSGFRTLPDMNLKPAHSGQTFAAASRPSKDPDALFDPQGPVNPQNARDPWAFPDLGRTCYFDRECCTRERNIEILAPLYDVVIAFLRVGRG
jgi:hypothetical protein